MYGVLSAVNVEQQDVRTSTEKYLHMSSLVRRFNLSYRASVSHNVLLLRLGQQLHNWEVIVFFGRQCGGIYTVFPLQLRTGSSLSGQTRFQFPVTVSSAVVNSEAKSCLRSTRSPSTRASTPGHHSWRPGTSPYQSRHWR